MQALMRIVSFYWGTEADHHILAGAKFRRFALYPARLRRRILVLLRIGRLPNGDEELMVFRTGYGDRVIESLRRQEACYGCIERSGCPDRKYTSVAMLRVGQ